MTRSVRDNRVDVASDDVGGLIEQGELYQKRCLAYTRAGKHSTKAGFRKKIFTITANTH